MILFYYKSTLTLSCNSLPSLSLEYLTQALLFVRTDGAHPPHRSLCRVYVEATSSWCCFIITRFCLPLLQLYLVAKLVIVLYLRLRVSHSGGIQTLLQLRGRTGEYHYDYSPLRGQESIRLAAGPDAEHHCGGTVVVTAVIPRCRTSRISVAGCKHTPTATTTKSMLPVLARNGGQPRKRHCHVGRHKRSNARSRSGPSSVRYRTRWLVHRLFEALSNLAALTACTPPEQSTDRRPHQFLVPNHHLHPQRPLPPTPPTPIFHSPPDTAIRSP